MPITLSKHTLRGRVRWWSLMCLAALAGWLLGCAAGVGPHGEVQSGGPDEVSISFPPYNGPKRRVQVIEIKIPAEDIRRYPELAEKRVGFGLSNILVETLYDTNRFTFLEEKEQVLKRLVELWELTALSRPPMGLNSMSTAGLKKRWSPTAKTKPHAWPRTCPAKTSR